MARKFLWIVATLVSLAILAGIVWIAFADRLIRFAFVPGAAYAETQLAPAPDYAAKASWVARPDIPGNPALWTPNGYSAAPKPAAAVFFVSPTAYLSRSRWNAPLDDPDTNDRLDRFTRMQASVFNGVAEVWVPRYRQATFGSFLKPSADADKALDLAYTDVERAFDAFLAAQPADRPIIVAGHSQGARHLLKLLQARRAVLSGRLVAAYAVGWAVAMPDDPITIGLPPCTAAGQAGCLASWQSFAADADLATALKDFPGIPDASGKPLGARAMLCVNPLSGSSAAAEARQNAGTLIDGALVPHKVGASCNKQGVLLISPTPKDIGPFVLPNGNFHVYDFSLFWANIRADVEARLSSFGAAKLGQGTLPATP
ncbi:DUF3089 domain-containing protein [Sandaracinobacteroides hominis]|uniref:DUF3089 domain-containing protein n=1 Tax=Sandaracinobacteroides hominis TaxID=2780086 RepID=UPI0018F4314A|nr:DUF3089 domain-containing protein [Sandaracinobacteroides hominis]